MNKPKKNNTKKITKMKIAIQIVLGFILLILGVGFYLNQLGHSLGNFMIGIGALSIAFLLIPLFLYHRYRGKKLEDYTLNKEKIDKMIDNLKS